MFILETEQLKKFKSLIGFEQTPRIGDSDKGVVLDWPSPREWGQLKEGAWQIEGDTIRIHKGAVDRNWNLSMDEESISIEVFVSSAGPDLARQHLLEIASNTTMMEIPFTKGPEDLGHLAIQEIDPQPQYFVWTFYNLCFKIMQDNNTTDVLNLARWIQKHVDGYVKDNISQYRPKITKVELSSKQISVGETVTVQVQPAATEDTERLLVELANASDHLDCTLQEDLSLCFEGLKPGKAEIHLILADKKNLLSTSAVVSVEVLGSKEP